MNMARLGIGSEPLGDVPWHHLDFIHIALLYSLEQVPTGMQTCYNWLAFRTKYFR